MAKVLMKGTEAIAEAAIQAGCRYFYGYPITPQNEIPEYMSSRLPQVGGVFLQCESEVASINALMGGAATGYRAMTTSSSPGISLMAEGMSYIAMGELPCVIVNVMRAGPGLGGILPAQGDYFQATRNAGHGDYRMIVLAPDNLQEAVDLIQDGFDLSQKYRTPVMVLADGFMGQMMEAVEIKTRTIEDPKSNAEWALGWRKERGGARTIVYNLKLKPEDLEIQVTHLQQKYLKIRENEQRVERYLVEDAELVIAAYGTTSRMARTAIDRLRNDGLKVGLIRPITLWPYPVKGFRDLPASVKLLLDVEMSSEYQMLDDVKISTECRLPVETYGRWGGFTPSVHEIEDKCRELLGKLGKK
ncbi:3-methyl-2-oxobutanoate dehydrogenase subunit VorB [uncultured Fretibacterium sp.]|uniref:3-methyl-2-oxobutanoate dehydrogenase subunit VorB n=1 Tax=uncultured Fretibacterium sp. TaxID=1678694 RepID=UPI00325FBCBC